MAKQPEGFDYGFDPEFSHGPLNKEMIQRDENGLLSDFFNPEDLSQTVCALLKN